MALMRPHLALLVGLLLHGCGGRDVDRATARQVWHALQAAGLLAPLFTASLPAAATAEDDLPQLAELPEVQCSAGGQGSVSLLSTEAWQRLLDSQQVRGQSSGQVVYQLQDCGAGVAGLRLAGALHRAFHLRAKGSDPAAAAPPQLGLTDSFFGSLQLGGRRQARCIIEVDRQQPLQADGGKVPPRYFGWICGHPAAGLLAGDDNNAS